MNIDKQRKQRCADVMAQRERDAKSPYDRNKFRATKDRLLKEIDDFVEEIPVKVEQTKVDNPF
jgi:hypothetical protein